AADPLPDRPAQRIDSVDNLTAVRIARAGLAVRTTRVAVTAGLTQCRAGPQVTGRRNELLGDGTGQPRVPACRVTHCSDPAGQRPAQPPGSCQRHVTERLR